MKAKIKVTQQQRDNALDALNNMWPSVPRKNVRDELADYGGLYIAVNGEQKVLDGEMSNREIAKREPCKSAACFGGWCTQWPAFRNQGVRTHRKSTWVPTRGNISGHEVAHFLFGDSAMFDSLQDGEPDDPHDAVTERLKKLIENSEVI